MASVSQRPRSGWVLQFIWLAAGACLALTAVQAAWSLPNELEHRVDLAVAERLAKRDRVPVIVMLETRARFGKALGKEALKADRDELAIRQQAVLSALNAAGAKSRGQTKLFTRTPGVALEIDRADLAVLESHPDVARVVVDELDRPSLRTTTGIIGADLAWDREYIGTGYAVAVLDTGVGPHQMLDSKIVYESCFSTTRASDGSTSVCPFGQPTYTAPGAGAACDFEGCEHGTHVAGIAAGLDVDAPGGQILGVAFDASVLAIQIFSKFTGPSCEYTSPCTLSYTSDQIRALDKVIELADDPGLGYTIASVNMSLGGGEHSTTCDGDPRTFAIDQLLARNIATVIASGNESYDAATGAPGCISAAITVGATTKSDDLAGYSNTASWVDLLAPGSDVCSAVTGGQGSGCGGTLYEQLSGTSMAAPHVAGAWALMRSRKHDASVELIREALRVTGTLIDTPLTPMPRINVNDAIDAIDGDSLLETDVPARGLAWQSGTKFRSFYIDVPAGKPLLMVRTTGLVGNADLYVRRGSRPTTSAFDCRSDSGGSNEECLIANPAEGRWWIGLRPVAAYGNLTLLASYTRQTNSLRVESFGDQNVAISVFSGPGSLAGTTTYTRSGILSGTAVELRAPLSGPTDETIFSHWSGCDSVSGTGRAICALTFNGNRELEAHYKPYQFNLQVASNMSGAEIAGSPAAAGGFATYSRQFPIHTAVALTAPGAQYTATFVGWTGCDSTSGSGNRTCHIVMENNAVVQAQYNIPSYPVNVQSNGAEGVYIDGFPNGNTNYSINLAAGKLVKLTAPDSAGGLAFQGWTGCDAVLNGGLLCTTVVDGPETMVANYGAAGSTFGFVDAFAPPTWTDTTLSFGCGASAVDKSASEFVLTAPAGCSDMSASTRHGGVLDGPGTISVDYEITAGSGNSINAYVGLEYTLLEGWNGSATGTLSFHLEPGQRALFYLRKLSGSSNATARFHNFVFKPDPSPQLYSNGFE